MVVQFLRELLCVRVVVHWLDEHFGREPGLFEDMCAGADVNALFEFEDAAGVI